MRHDVVKHSDQRVGIFVDTQNMYHSARNLHGGRLNFKAVLEAALAGRKLIHAIAYVIAAEAQEEESFFDALNKSGFAVKMKDIQTFAGGAKKADWDVGLAIDAVKFADKLDVVVLMSGDGDFVPLVHYLQENKGCHVEVVSFRKTTSQKLVEVADDFTDLGENTSQFIRVAGKIGKRN
ncbi:NYN domain-containing protein [Candidatus Uhrbacteria bacterium]|nr:NYN domain-containing protein [Candidatus Uhrbacteria bacterium]